MDGITDFLAVAVLITACSMFTGAALFKKVSALSLICGAAVFSGWLFIITLIAGIFSIPFTSSFILAASIPGIAALYYFLKRTVAVESSVYIVLVFFMAVSVKMYVQLPLFSLPGMDMVFHCEKAQVMSDLKTALPDMNRFSDWFQCLYPQGFHILLCFVSQITVQNISAVFCALSGVGMILWPVLMYETGRAVKLPSKFSLAVSVVSFFSYSVFEGYQRFSLLPAFYGLFYLMVSILLFEKNKPFAACLACFAVLCTHPHSAFVLAAVLILMRLKGTQNIAAEKSCICAAVLYAILHFKQITEYAAIKMYCTPLLFFQAPYDELFSNPLFIQSLVTAFTLYFGWNLTYAVLGMYGSSVMHRAGAAGIAAGIFLAGFLYALFFSGALGKTGAVPDWRLFFYFDSCCALAAFYGLYLLRTFFKNKIIFGTTVLFCVFHLLIVYSQIIRVPQNPANGSFNADDLKAYDWIQNNLPENAVFAGGFNNTGEQWVSCFTGRRTLYYWKHESLYQVYKIANENMKKSDFSMFQRGGAEYLYVSFRNLPAGKKILSEKDLRYIASQCSIVYENQTAAVLKLPESRDYGH